MHHSSTTVQTFARVACAATCVCAARLCLHRMVQLTSFATIYAWCMSQHWDRLERQKVCCTVMMLKP